MKIKFENEKGNKLPFLNILISLKGPFAIFLIFFLITVLFGLLFQGIWKQICQIIVTLSALFTCIGVFISFPIIKITNKKIKNYLIAICMGFIVAYFTIPPFNNLINSQEKSFLEDTNDSNIDTANDSNIDTANDSNIDTANDSNIDTANDSNVDTANDSSSNETNGNNRDMANSNGINGDNDDKKKLGANDINAVNESVEANAENGDDPTKINDPLPPDVAESIMSEGVFTPATGGSELFTIIDDELLKVELERTGENKINIENNIKYYLGIKKSSQGQEDSKTINGNVDFTSRTKKANELHTDLETNGYTLDKIKEIIRLREEALDIYISRGLCKSLAEDYRDLARLYLADKKWELAYFSYIESINYEVIYIKLVNNIDDYNYCLYRIAIVYQSIGDIPTIDNGIRKDAYYLAACIFEIVYEYAMNERNLDYGFKSSYYAGMVNHKLISLCKETEGKSISYYLVDALKYYEKSLEYSDYTKQRISQYNYIIQVCNNAIDYIRRYGSADNLLTINEYNEKIAFYEELTCNLLDYELEN